MAKFTLLGPISKRKPIAVGNKIRELDRLQREYGPGNWRKYKGEAKVLMTYSGIVRRVELHWYEAHGVGRVEEKIKRDIR